MTVGQSHQGRLLVVAFAERGEAIRIISARRATRRERDSMKKAPKNKRAVAEMRAEYDFSAGKRGTYARRFAEGSNLVVLEPDVSAAFPDSEAVNEALRTLAKIARRTKTRPR